jgi:isopentenyl-diphosphate delta-isomerase type 1
VLTMEEYFDVVDENDNVIGRAPRSECHSNPNIIHRAVGVVVVRRDGTILLSKRSMKKDTNPGKWEILGGHNQPGESYIDAAKRELHEELGLKLELKKIARFVWRDPRETELSEIFTALIPDSAKVSFNDGEVSEVMFMPLNDIAASVKSKKLAMTPWSLRSLDEYKNYLQSNPI